MLTMTRSRHPFIFWYISIWQRLHCIHNKKSWITPAEGICHTHMWVHVFMSTRHEQHEDHLQSLEGDHLALVAWHPKCCCMLSQPHTSGKQPFSQGGQPDISPAVAIMPSTKVMVCCSISQKCISNSTILNVPCVEVARAVTHFDLQYFGCCRGIQTQPQASAFDQSLCLRIVAYQQPLNTVAQNAVSRQCLQLLHL